MNNINSKNKVDKYEIIICLFTREQNMRYYQKTKNQQKQRQAEQQQVVENATEKCDKAKAENFWEEQKRFMQDKKDSIAKLQQDRLNALLDLEESFSFKPRINKESREIANKTHDKNFDDRIQRFVNTKQTHLELQKELLKPQFQPLINNKSRRLAKSTEVYNFKDDFIITVFDNHLYPFRIQYLYIIFNCLGILIL